MDQVPLVENQIDDGERLAVRLSQEGITVTAACWIKASEDGQWFLYVVSPIVDNEGFIKAYRRVHSVIRQMPQPFWINPLEVKLISPTEPVAKAVANLQRRYSGKGGIWYGQAQLGGMSIEGAYLYEPNTTPAQ